MKWLLIAQILLTDDFATVGVFDTEQRCKYAESVAVSRHELGLLAEPPFPMTITWCLEQRPGMPVKGDGLYTCKYPVGKCAKKAG